MSMEKGGDRTYKTKRQKRSLLTNVRQWLNGRFESGFLISEGTADIEIRELPAGGIVSAEGGV